MPKTNTAPSPVDAAVLCKKIPLQGHCQASAFGSVPGALAEGSVLAEQDRCGSRPDSAHNQWSADSSFMPDAQRFAARR